PPRGAAGAGVLVDHRDVVEDRELLDRLLGLERAPEAPAGAAVVDQLQQVLAERPDRAFRGLHEAGQDVEERRLSGAVRADPPTGAARERDAHVVDRGDPGEAHREAFDLDHAVFLPKGFATSRPSLARSFGTWSASPPGAVSSTWSSPAPKIISRKFVLMCH